MESLLYGSLQVLKLSCSGVITFFVLKENLRQTSRVLKLKGMRSLNWLGLALLVITLVWVQALGFYFLLEGQDSLSGISSGAIHSAAWGKQRRDEPGNQASHFFSKTLTAIK